MNNLSPLVSIITPLFKSEKYISETIRSVQHQTLTDYEHIIVDDCSPDNSYDVALSFAEQDNRIVLLRNEHNMRVSLTRNRAIDLARGKYLLFLDSDDILTSDALECLVDTIEAGDYSIVTGPYQKMSEDGSRFFGIITPPQCVDYSDMLKTCTMPFMTTMLRRDIIGEHRLKNIHHEDYLFWLGLLAKGYKCYGYREKALGFYRLTSNSLSRNKLKTFQYQWNIYANELQLGSVKSIYYFVHYAFNGILKYMK